MSTRVSGLSDEHASHARALISKSAHVMVTHKNEIRYSQGSDRWVGIQLKMSITDGRFPKTCDCSSAAQWMLWDALARPYGVHDLVSHSHWAYGYTGSQYRNGKAVIKDRNLKIGDFIFYGDQGGGIPEHVAVYVGGGMVFSNGSMAGPYILRLDYRKDRRMARRFI